ncbi:MAG: M48 family metalloprotease [Acidimicrobiales bacterium]
MADKASSSLLLGAGDDGAELSRNHRLALAIAAAPAVVVLVVVAGVCTAVGLAVEGVAVGVVAGIALWAWVWRGATARILRALRTRPGGDAELARAETLAEGLCATMGVEVPDILVVDDTARQALAVGRSSATAVLVVTSGLLEALDPVLLEGVLAHELVHVKWGDIAPATVAAAVALPLARLVPVAGLVHTLAGRGRELRTDRLAVSVTRYPPGLRDALALMAEGPASRPTSPLAARGVGDATRWLWTVALPEDPGASALRSGLVDELDAPALRIAALDEW